MKRALSALALVLALPSLAHAGWLSNRDERDAIQQMEVLGVKDQAKGKAIAVGYSGIAADGKGSWSVGVKESGKVMWNWDISAAVPFMMEELGFSPFGGFQTGNISSKDRPIELQLGLGGAIPRGTVAAYASGGLFRDEVNRMNSTFKALNLSVNQAFNNIGFTARAQRAYLGDADAKALGEMLREGVMDELRGGVQVKVGPRRGSGIGVRAEMIHQNTRYKQGSRDRREENNTVLLSAGMAF